tara:strand:+ start:109 stop:585 length:477 start_codon:yes stop_codon:yes gene_type:complete
MFNLTTVLSILQNSLLYDQNAVFFVDFDGKEHKAHNFSEVLKNSDNTIKIERMENFSRAMNEECLALAKKYNHTEGPVTCHLFYAKKGSPSFKPHTDPFDVVIYCCEGTKTIEMNDIMHDINSGEYFHIPSGTLHQAFNNSEALTLSFSLEDYIENII